MHGKENNYKNAFIVSFLLLIRTNRNMKVTNDCVILKCGRRVIGEVTLQTPTRYAFQWYKLNW
jgi:hypothetical protein